VGMPCGDVGRHMLGMCAGVLEEPLNIAGRCHQPPSLCNPYSQQRTAVHCDRPVLRPPVRIMPSSARASVSTCFISLFSFISVVKFENWVTNDYQSF